MVSPSRPRASTAKYDHLVKLILIGDEGTGKSSLMTRFCDQHFSSSYVATIGVDFKIRTIEVDVEGGARAVVKMQMWDTAGQERFNSITKSFYRGAHVLVVVYDVTNRESFNHVTRWLSGCLEVTGSTIPTCLIGNKSDLERIRQVDTEEGATLASHHGMHFTEASAKDGDNVATVFSEMAAQYVRKVREETVVLHSHAGPHTVKPVGRLHGTNHDGVDAGASCWHTLFAGFKNLFKSSSGNSGRGGSSAHPVHSRTAAASRSSPRS